MSETVSFSWVGQNLQARAATSLYYTANSQLYVPTWDRHACWLYTPSTQVFSAVDLGITDGNPFFESALGYGYVSCAVYGGNLWALSSDGRIISHNLTTSVNTVVSNPLPTGLIPCAVEADSTGVLVLATSGAVYHMTTISSTPTLIGTFGAFVSSFAYYSGNIYATVASTQKIGVMTNPGGVVTTVNTSIQYPCYLDVSSNGIAVGGYSNAGLTGAYLDIQADPQNPSSVAVGIMSSSTTVNVITGADPTWSVTSTVTASAQPVSVAWVPNGEQVMVVNSAALQVFAYASGALTSSQTLSLSGGGKIAVTSDSVSALVCNTSANSLDTYVSTLGVWAAGATVTGLTGALDVVSPTSSSAYVLGSSNVYYLTRTGVVWSLISTIAISTGTPSALAYDSVSSNTYIVASDGSNGYLYALSAGNVISTAASWTGSGDDVAVFSNRVIVLDKTNSSLRIYASNSPNYSNQEYTNASIVSSPVAVSVTNDTIWVMGLTSAVELNLYGGPLITLAYRKGSIATYTLSGYTETIYSISTIEDIPTAVKWSANGNVFVSTQHNNFLKLTSAAALSSSFALGTYGDQEAGTPLGISGLAQNGTSWYGVTCLSGVFITITGVTD